MELGFVMSNGEASYIAILFSNAREAGLNEQQIKPCVPLVDRQVYWITGLIHLF